MKNMNKLLIILLIFFFFCNLCLAQRVLKRYDYYPKNENDIYFRMVSDMTLNGDNLIAVINVDHSVLMFSTKEGIKFMKELGGPGQGPGEFTRPMAATSFNQKIAIKDSQGLSIFNENGEFLKRYTKYFRGKNLIYQGNKVYHLNFNPENPHLINEISLEGDLLSEFGTKYTLDPSKLKGANPVSASATVHKGKLIYDGEFIFYLNAVFGKLFKFTNEGKKLLERDLVDLVGESGKTAQKKNEDIWIKKGLEDRTFFPYWPLFIDAAYYEGRIYLLIDLKAHGIKGLDGWIIRSFNTTTLDFSDEYNIDIEEVRRIYSFVVKVVEGAPIFYLSVDTDDTYVIAEYK